MKKVKFLLVVAILMVVFLPTWGIAGHDCCVPYNIKQPGWWTGLHISNVFFNETIYIYFWRPIGNGEWENYAVVTLESDQLPWTGYVWDLLDDPSDFHDKTLLWFSSDIGQFMVTQFIGNTSSTNMGFGFQTFYSWPESQPFPYGGPLSIPPGGGPSRGIGAERMR